MLYLVPVSLGESPLNFILPQEVLHIVHRLDEFIVENEKSARQFLKQCGTPIPQQQLIFHVLDKHNPDSGIKSFFNSMLNGKDVGLLSEAGCPAVADPGALVVRQAHELGIRVVPLTGPSSILLALMASGMNGQQFCFHGYLPVEQGERIAAIKKLEKESAQKNQTQLFIETPYRNNRMLADLTGHCQSSSLLCVAVDLTTAAERITTRKIADWKKNLPDLNKRPAVFLLLAE